MVDQITINVDDNVKPEKVAFLANKSIDELRQIASLMPKQEQQHQVDYYGRQPLAVETEAENVDREDMLEDGTTEIDYVANSVFAEAK